MKFIKKFLFHRATFVTIAILIQLVVLISVILRFNDYFVFFYSASILISIVSVLLVMNQRMNPIYKIAWIVPILLFPIFGGLFYIFYNGDKLNKGEKHRMKSIDTRMKGALPHQQAVLDEIRRQNEHAANQSKYIRDYAFCPPYPNTFTQYLPNGESTFEKLTEALKKAERYIFLEYFIIGEGFMWNTILGILQEKAALGVDVRVIYDDVGCLLSLPYRYDKKLEALGIKCCIFNPLVPVLTQRLNNRDHRKIAVIDGHIGFTGGINLADEYINKIEKHGHWKDAAIMFEGEAVWNLTVMFLSMWSYLRNQEEDFRLFKSNAPAEFFKGSKGYIQPFSDSPLDGETVGQIVYLNLINKARRYVYITTPYLIIDHELMTALTSSAKGGVDVRIITPYCGDRRFVHEVTRSNYNTLIESGVKIYEYLPGFIHCKNFMVDDEYGVVGTINMDYRSLYLHFECGVWMYNSDSIAHMKEDFTTTLKMCKQITTEDFRHVKWYRKLVRLVLRIFAPFM